MIADVWRLYVKAAMPATKVNTEDVVVEKHHSQARLHLITPSTEL